MALIGKIAFGVDGAKHAVIHCSELLSSDDESTSTFYWQNTLLKSLHQIIDQIVTNLSNLTLLLGLLKRLVIITNSLFLPENMYVLASFTSIV